MSGGELAAVIAAIAGLLTAGFGGWRALRGDKVGERAAAAASVLSGLQGLVTTLQGEVQRLNGEIRSLREECAQERIDQREEHRQEMDALREEHRNEMLAAYERIDELGTQVYVLQNRPPESKQRRTDKK